MYVATFYSFKGGVGRTMALVNIAYQLALTGRRVLVMDFDLEAPGIDTFDVLRPNAPTPGVVEFVSEYLATRMSPDVRRFVHEARLPASSTGWLGLFPAGLRDDGYQGRLASIDWSELYERHDGFLLLEDLKGQLEQHYAPDYLLVDSRTGHTDVGGICTRQLPDAVVAMFFPNDQNLIGLERVVSEIRAEAAPPRGKSIALLFAMSNVPDLDDEDRILQSRVDAFRRRLNCADFAAVIHRYESLSLLNQAVFTQTRPRSRLAVEYGGLCRALIAANPGDVEGTLDWLRALRLRLMDRQHTATDVELGRLGELERIHGRNPAVLGALAETRLDVLDLKRAEEMAELAVSLSPDDVGNRLIRSRVRTVLNQKEGAVGDVLAVIESARAKPQQIKEALYRLRELSPNKLADVVARLPLDAVLPVDRVQLAQYLNKSEADLQVAANLLESVIREEGPGDRAIASSAAAPLMLTYIGLRRFEDAMAIRGGMKESRPERIELTFNTAFAQWGCSGEVPVEGFKRVLALQQKELLGSANYAQCMALAASLTGNQEEALRLHSASRDAIRRTPIPTFSCWRYLVVDPSVFADDLYELESFIRRGSPPPLVLRRATTETSMLPLRPISK